jgi:hypothetical protein
VHYYTLAAHQGVASAQDKLGYAYLNGKGVEQNDYKAAHYYTLAAKQGYNSAENNLGLMYEHGDGVVQSDTKAVHYYTLAANKGHAISQNNLGHMYKHGKGVVKNYTKALQYYKRAAEQGSEDAQISIDKVYKNPEACKEIATDREMAIKYCLGCGKERKLKTCANCKVARFCSTECMQRTWIYHKPHCNMWENEGE